VVVDVDGEEWSPGYEDEELSTKSTYVNEK